MALALVKRLQQTTRPDLKIVVMSATLEAGPVARYLSDDADAPAPMLASEGRTFPVSIRWAEYGDERPASEQAADAVERIVRNGDPGDILVFMPGMGEINSTINALRDARLGERCAFIPLHGDLQPEDQDRAFQPSDVRKIVVSTNVAETSVTIDGVCHVVDAGLARIARHDAERGIQTLAVEAISRASADQRSGRAGRTAPGTCWRLWTESAHLDRPAKNTPEDPTRRPRGGRAPAALAGHPGGRAVRLARQTRPRRGRPRRTSAHHPRRAQGRSPMRRPRTRAPRRLPRGATTPT